ncbi:MAG: hypothetical protein AUH85_09065 [Chloroflexi bacterium 13_1_40CM_4_68_4]|nr:MAG: hypothetical protein AUH85_09065 [Chloroflexi bacterium 13_1_40CM_4_68_4]
MSDANAARTANFAATNAARPPSRGTMSRSVPQPYSLPTSELATAMRASVARLAATSSPVVPKRARPSASTSAPGPGPAGCGAPRETARLAAAALAQVST